MGRGVKEQPTVEEARAQTAKKYAVCEAVNASVLKNAYNNATKTIYGVIAAVGPLVLDKKEKIVSKQFVELASNPFFAAFVQAKKDPAAAADLSPLKTKLAECKAELDALSTHLHELNSAAAFTKLFGVEVNAKDKEVQDWLTKCPHTEYGHVEKLLTGAVDFALSHPV